MKTLYKVLQLFENVKQNNMRNYNINRCIDHLDKQDSLSTDLQKVRTMLVLVRDSINQEPLIDQIISELKEKINKQQNTL